MGKHTESLYLQRLLELISKEEVILFAGAGLSKYAGYPMGSELQKIFYDGLTVLEKQENDSNKSLSELTQDINYLRGGDNEIIRTLKEQFLKKPTNTFVHDTIAKIPHFKTIITTNYDKLFENAYESNAELLYKNEHVSLSEPTKTQILKIHGDLSSPDSIILKKSDYTNFFIPSIQDSVYWNFVKSKMASNCILFIGYALEDSNIDFIFDEIIKQLGDYKREAFFVAPSISETKRNKLSRNNISFIQSTGEELFPIILKYLNENIILDVQKKKVSVDTTHKFVNGLGYNLSLGSNRASEFFLEKLEKVEGLSSQKVNFTIGENKKFIESFQKFMSNNTLEKKFKIPKEQLLKLEIKLDDFRIHDLDNIQSLYLMKLADYEGCIDLMFEDGFELLDFYVKVFKTNLTGKTVITFDTKVANGSITFFESDGGMKISYDSEIVEVIEDPRLLLNYFQCFLKIMSGLKFTILVDGKNVFSRKLADVKKPNDLSFFTDFLELLVRVEKIYTVRFKNLIYDV